MGNFFRDTRKELIVLLFVSIIHLATNITWLLNNTSPLPWDQAGHQLIILHHSYFFNSLFQQNPLSLLTISPYYPPLIHIAASIPALILKESVFSSSIIITAMFIATILLVFINISLYFKNKQLALMTAITYSFSPIIYEHSRWFLLEIPLILMLLFSSLSLALFKTKPQKKFIYLFSVFAAGSMLVKWISIIYLIPFLIIFIQKIYIEYKNKNINLSSLIIGLTIFLSLTFPWYFTNAGFILNESRKTILPESSDPQLIFSKENFMFYFYQLYTFQVTIFFIIFSIFFIPLAKTIKKNQLLFIIIYPAYIYIFFTLIPNKDPRYTMPIVIFICLYISHFLLSITSKIKILGYFLTSLFIAYIIILFGILSFRGENFSYQKAVNTHILGWIDVININDNIATAASKKDWPHLKIHQLISEDSRGENVNVLMLVDRKHFNLGNFLLNREQNGFWSILTLPAPDSINRDGEQAKSLLNEYDYIITTDGNVGVEATRNIDVLNYLSSFINQHKVDWFINVGSFETPEKNWIYVYKTNL